MAMADLLFDGALRAAQFVALVFTLNAPADASRPVQPAVLQSPATQATPVLDLSDAPQQLPLAARHLDVVVAGRQALVRSTLVYRNAAETPVEVRYAVPAPADVIGPGARAIAPLDSEFDTLAAMGRDVGCADVEDDAVAAPAGLAQWLEDGALPDEVYERGAVRLAPGEELVVRLYRLADVGERGQGYALELPVPAESSGSGAAFSADVVIDADAPVKRLRSTTHAGEIDGLGGRQAHLTVPAQASAHRTLTIEFELAAPASSVSSLAQAR